MQAAADHYGVELVVVLNADTGYIFDLDDALYAEVLRRFRAEFPGAKFIAGVTARGAENDTAFKAERYRPLLDIVQQHENCEVMLMTSRWLNALDPEPCRDAYYEIAEWLIRPGIVHALEPAFVPWATPFEPVAALAARAASEVRRRKNQHARRAALPLLGGDVPRPRPRFRAAQRRRLRHRHGDQARPAAAHRRRRERRAAHLRGEGHVAARRRAGERNSRPARAASTRASTSSSKPSNRWRIRSSASMRT